MRDSLFWRTISLLLVLSMFYVGYGLGRGELPTTSASASPRFTFEDDYIQGQWERVHFLHDANGHMQRIEVPGGWLIRFERDSKKLDKGRHGRTSGIGIGLTFLPDPKHQWRGEGLED